MESDANIYKNQIKGFAEVTGNFHPINYYKSADSPRRNSAMVIQIKNNLWLGSMLKSDCKLSLSSNGNCLIGQLNCFLVLNGTVNLAVIIIHGGNLNSGLIRFWLRMDRCGNIALIKLWCQ